VTYVAELLDAAVAAKPTAHFRALGRRKVRGDIVTQLSLWRRSAIARSAARTAAALPVSKLQVGRRRLARRQLLAASAASHSALAARCGRAGRTSRKRRGTGIGDRGEGREGRGCRGGARRTALEIASWNVCYRKQRTARRPPHGSAWKMTAPGLGCAKTSEGALTVPSRDTKIPTRG
jgi:hypothetical protein